MLVHDKSEEFPYKAPFVHRIKSAFDEMLRKFAVELSPGLIVQPAIPRGNLFRL
jgi:hypothetical protein